MKGEKPFSMMIKRSELLPAKDGPFTEEELADLEEGEESEFSDPL
jgi:hypothetical protein